MSEAQIVWNSTVDNGQYYARVTRIHDDRGLLEVFVGENDTGKFLLEEEVVLSYGAVFGPDVADVALWEGKAITVIDEHIAKQG